MNKTFLVPIEKPMSKVQMVCLPYAGGTASTYIPWAAKLSESTELLAVQYPGRANRISEKSHESVSNLVNEIFCELEKSVTKPFVLFGHSLGSRIGFELIKKIEREGGELPRHFIASGSRAPHLSSKDRDLHALPKEGFLRELRRLGGTPNEVLNNAELFELFEPSIRTDFKMSDTYESGIEKKYDVPITVFSGEDDVDISQSDLVGWRHHFSSGFSVKMFSGGHFFIEDKSQIVIHEINRILEVATDFSLSLV